MGAIKNHCDISEARDMSFLVENIKNEFNDLKQKVKDLHYEEQNLGILIDTDLDADNNFEDFANYQHLWTFAD